MISDHTNIVETAGAGQSQKALCSRVDDGGLDATQCSCCDEAAAGFVAES